MMRDQIWVCTWAVDRKKRVFLPCFPANLLISNSVSLFITLLAVSRWIVHIPSKESLLIHCAPCVIFSLRRQLKKHSDSAEHDVTGRPMTARVSTRCSVLSYRRETALQGALYSWPKVEDWNWETIFYGHYRSVFNRRDIIGLKICRIHEKNAK